MVLSNDHISLVISFMHPCNVLVSSTLVDTKFKIVSWNSSVFMFIKTTVLFWSYSDNPDGVNMCSIVFST